MVMTKKSPTFWCCFLLVALSQLFVAVFSREPPIPPPTPTPPQFSDDKNPPGVKDISLVVNNRDSNSTISGSELIGKINEESMITSNIWWRTNASTHIVTPGHVLRYGSNHTVDKIDLRTLIGSVLVVNIPKEIQRITAEVLKSLNLPLSLKRVIFRTGNTIAKLTEVPFYANYTGLTPDAATWLAQSPSIELIGIDYVSVAVNDQTTEVYENLFAKQTIVAVEGLSLIDINPGEYTVYCFPLRAEAQSSPARCILVE